MLTGDGEPERVSATAITANYFSTLGIVPMRGPPLVFATVTVALVLAGLVACVLPARQATRVDPLVALRSEA